MRTDPDPKQKQIGSALLSVQKVLTRCQGYYNKMGQDVLDTQCCKLRAVEGGIVRQQPQDRKRVVPRAFSLSL